MSQSRERFFAMNTVKEIHIKTEDCNLYCRVIGKGEPLIVIHGGPGLSMDYMLPALERLANDRMVIFYDQRGNGHSDGEINHETMNLERFIADLRAIQDHFKLQSTGLLGHSWGAYLALAYALRYPAQVSELILANSIPVVWKKPTADDQPDWYENMIAGILNSDAFKHDHAAGMTKFYKDSFQHSFEDTALVGKLNLDQMSASQVKNSALIHRIFEENFFNQTHDLRPQLSALAHIPTLIIHGSCRDVPLSVAEELHSLMHGSKLEVLDSGHFPFIEKSDEFFTAITQFHGQNLALKK